MEHVKWQNKMNSIPIKEDVDDSWKEMEALLNHYHPVMEFTTASKGTLKVIIAKLASMLGYVLPAAAMITVGTYVITPKTSENKRTINSNTRAPKKQQIGTPLHQTPDTALKEKDTLSRLIVVSDSLKQFKMERVPLRMRVRKSVEGDKYKDNGYSDSVYKFNNIPEKRKRVVDTVAKDSIQIKPHLKPRKRNILPTKNSID